jgi:hypothetical protein
MANKQPNKYVSVAHMISLVLLDELRKMGSFTRLQLLNRGVSERAIRQLEKRGILRTSTDALGITQYTVVDDFLSKLT